MGSATTPVAGHPFQVLASQPDDPYCAYQAPCRSGHTDCTVDCGWCKGTGVERQCNLPEANARHRGAFVALVEVHSNSYDILREEVQGIQEFIANRDDDDIWTETKMPAIGRPE